MKGKFGNMSEYMILSDSTHLAAQYYRPLEFLRIQWLNPNSLRYLQATMQRVLVACARLRIERILLDLNCLPDLGMSEQVWLGERWLPCMVAQPLKCVALVIPPDQLYNQMVVESILQQGQDQGQIRFDIQFFTEPLTALEWVTDTTTEMPLLEQEWQLASAMGNSFC